MRIAITALLPLTLLAGCGGAAPPPAPPRVPTFTAQAGYPRISGEIVDWYLARHPVWATTIGEHAYDTTLGAYFAGDLERATFDARALLTRLAGINQPTLAREDFLDYRLLEHALRAELLDLEEIGGWQRDPVRYVRMVPTGWYSTPGVAEPTAESRIATMIARWRRVPLLFRAARQNLVASEVPPLYVRQAVRTARDLTGYLGGEIDNALEGAPRGNAEWDAARSAAIASTDSFATWLERDFGPSASGDFRLGATQLGNLLLHRRGIDLPLQDLQAINRQAIEEYVETLDRLALEADPMRHPHEIVDSLIQAVSHGGTIATEVAFLPDESRRTPVRAALPPRGLRFAIGHYEVARRVEDESIPAANRLLAVRAALVGHAMLHALLQLHAATAPLDEVARQVASIALIDFERARALTEEIAYDPEYGVGAIERMELFVLRDRLRADRGMLEEDAFVEELLELGLPIPLAAEALLGREPGRLLVAGRRTPGVPAPPSVLD